MRIKKRVVEEVIGHARREFPLEACGYLAGQEGVITASYPLSNMDRSSEHFSFDPKEQFAAMRNARSKGLELCAVYHSHPHTAARPSAEDMTLAYDPAIAYAIISLADGGQDLKLFTIKDRVVGDVPLEVIIDDRI